MTWGTVFFACGFSTGNRIGHMIWQFLGELSYRLYTNIRVLFFVKASSNKGPENKK